MSSMLKQRIELAKNEELRVCNMVKKINNNLLFQELTSNDAEKQKEKVRTAIVPVGALEQHGPHLPLGTDTIIINGLVDCLIKDLGSDYPVTFLPTLSIGKSAEHLNHYGTISLQSVTLISIMDDICFSLQKHGFKNIVFLNGHGGNLDLIKAFLFDIRYKYKLFPYCIHAGGEDGWNNPDFLNKVFPGMTYPDCHAGSVETSLIAFLRPDLVKDLEPFSYKKVIPSYPYGWATEDLSENGVIGDPNYYSAEAGEKAMHVEIKRIRKILDEIIR